MSIVCRYFYEVKAKAAVYSYFVSVLHVFSRKSVQNSLKFTYPIQGYCSFVNLYADKISASSCGESVPNYILIKYIDTKMKLSLLLLETHFWT